MSTFKESADDAALLLRGFQGLERVAAALNEAALLEQRMGELTTARDKAQSDLLSVKNELAGAQEAVNTAKGLAIELVAKAQSDAASIVQTAKREAGEAAAKALQEVQTQLDDRKAQAAEAEAQQTAATQRLAVVRAETLALEKRAEEARAYLANLTKA